MRMIGKFVAKEVDGTPHTLLILQDEHQTFDMHHGYGKADSGPATLKTDDGKEVNYVGKGEYEIFDGIDVIKVTSDDPDAP